MSFMTRPFRDNRNALMMSQLWNWLPTKYLPCSNNPVSKRYDSKKSYKEKKKNVGYIKTLSFRLFSIMTKAPLFFWLSSPNCPFFSSTYFWCLRQINQDSVSKVPKVVFSHVIKEEERGRHTHQIFFVLSKWWLLLLFGSILLSTEPIGNRA